MSQEREDFSKFGKSFQEGLCQLILADRPFADQLFEVFDVNFLELKYLRVFVGLIGNYRQKYKVHPTQKIMHSVIRTELKREPETIQVRIRDYFARTISSELEVEGAKYIKDISLDFCRKQKLKEAMIRSVSLIKKSSFDEISKVINDAIKLGSDNDFGYDYHMDFERRFEKKERNPVTTGWQDIDQLIKGGLGKGELGVCIAPTGAPWGTGTQGRQECCALHPGAGRYSGR